MNVLPSKLSMGLVEFFHDSYKDNVIYKVYRLHRDLPRVDVRVSKSCKYVLQAVVEKDMRQQVPWRTPTVVLKNFSAVLFRTTNLHTCASIAWIRRLSVYCISFRATILHVRHDRMFYCGHSWCCASVFQSTLSH